MWRSKVFLAILLLIVSSGYADWQIETIDGLPWFTSGFDCITDPDGIIHGTFYDSYDQDLYYVQIIDGSWIYQKIAWEENAGEISAICLDAEANVHILYSHEHGVYHDLYYLQSDNGTFSSDLIHRSTSRILSCDLVVSSTGTPHVVFEQERESQKVFYSSLVNNSWVSSQVIGDGRTVRIDLNNQEIPVICLRTAGYGRISIFKKNANQWIETELTDSYWVSGKIGFEIDPFNRVHITYYNRQAGTLNYAWKDEPSPAFTSITIGTPYEETSSHTLSLSAYNRTQIVFFENNVFKIFHESSPGTYTTDVISTVYSTDSLEICSPGEIDEVINLVVFDGSNECFLMGEEASPQWSFTPIQHRMKMGAINKCVLDSEDFMHLLYSDSITGTIKYARQTSTGWLVKTLIGASMAPGELFDLAIDQFDTIHLCYIRSDDSTLWYGTLDDDPPVLNLIHPAEMFKWDCNIEIDQLNNPHIYTVNSSTNKLIEFSQNTSYWTVMNLSGQLDSPTSPSVVFDAGNNRHVSYFNHQLFYRKNLLPPVSIASVTGNTRHQIAINSNDRLGITFNNGSELSLATWTGNFWRFRTVTTNAYEPAEHALWIDDDDIPHLAVKKLENKALHFTWLSDDEQWIDVIVDNTGNTGFAPTLIKGQDRNYRLAYSNGKLKYAVQDLFPSPTPTPVPTSTPPANEGSGCTINLSRTWLTAGDLFHCGVTAYNNYSLLYEEIPLFFIFEIGGSFYFAPGFSDFEHYTVTLGPFQFQYIGVFSFDWPDGAGTYSDARIYAAMTTADYTSLWGTMDVKTFGWGH